jgi:uncharacterized protein YjeT (DUF2065 family)
MSEFVTAIGLVLVIEGLLYAFVPGQLRQMMAMMQQVPVETLRMGGVAAMAGGVVIVWVARSLLGGS